MKKLPKLDAEDRRVAGVVKGSEATADDPPVLRLDPRTKRQLAAIIRRAIAEQISRDYFGW